MKKGFTLIELLVVVLIIGILASIALPQYQKAVEKSRLTEVMQNINTIQKCLSMHVLENGFPASDFVHLDEMGCAVQLTGGEWNNHSYETKYFQYYSPKCSSYNCNLYVNQKGGGFEIKVILNKDNTLTKRCFTNEVESGRRACKTLETLGYQYYDMAS